MPITIIQQPQSLTLVGCIPDIIAETTGLGMVVNLKVGATVLLAEYYTADQAGRARVNLRDFIDEFLEVDIPTSDLFEQTKSWKTFTVEITVGTDVTSFNFTALKGGSSKLTLDCPAFLKEAWLTWQVQTKHVHDVDPEWLSYFAQYDADVKVKAWFTGGISETITLHELLAGKHYSMNMTFTDIRELFVAQPIYFDVWVENKPAAPVEFTTWQMRYVLTLESFDYDDLFVFHNGLGGIDTIRFTGESRSVNPMEVGAALFYDEYEMDYLVTPRLAFEKNTGFFRSKEAMLWAQDFFLNKQRYIYQEEELLPIRLISPETITQDLVLVSYDFTYGYTRQTNYLALFKKKSPLIDPIIIGPGDSEFYLPPVISEFPQATDPAGLLFPVQKPGIPGWFFVTWETLLATIYEGIPAPAHNDTTGKQGGDPENDFFGHVTEKDIADLQALREGFLKKRKVEVSYTIESDTTGTLVIGKWYNDENELFEILSQPIVFLGAPDTGDFRWDLFVGNADGTASLVSGVEGTAAVRPDIPEGSVVLFELIWNELGEVTAPPTPGESVWSLERFSTRVEADTIGKYAKIMEMDLAYGQNYQFVLDYGAPAWEAANKVGSLYLAFVCTALIQIDPLTVKVLTTGFSEAGDFVLVQLPDNKAALYHKSTNYWMRLQWRVTFHNVAVDLSTFKQNQPYGTLPAGDNWQSEVYTINHNELPGLNVGDLQHLTAEELATAQGITRTIDDLGNPIQYQFPTTVSGLPATEPDEFVTLSQIPTVPQYGLLSGGTIFYSGTGQEYLSSGAVVAIGTVLNAPASSKTLDAADPTLDRFDVLGWRYVSQGVAELFYLKGTAAASPTIPQVNPESEVEGKVILVLAASTAPTGITTESVYEENTIPPEWTPSTTGTGTSAPANTENPKTGTKAVKISAIQNGFKQKFTRSAVLDISTYNTLGLDADLIATLGAGQGWTIGFLDASGNPASNSIALPINKGLTTYQFLALSLDLFTFTTTSIKGIVFSYVRTKGGIIHSGVFLDNIKLQGGVEQPQTPGAGVESITGDGVGGTPKNPVLTFPTPAEIGAQDDLGTDINAALLAANVPSGTNPFATEADIPAPGISHGASDGKVRGSKDGAWVDAKPVNKDPYANQAAMLADQASQIAGFIYIDGTSSWAKLATSTGVIADYVKVGDVAPGGGGGADTNAVHYNAADGKTSSEKQQARDNIGSSAGFAQVVTTIGAINNLSRTSNYIKFTSAGAVTLSGINEGVDGEEISIVNFTSGAFTILAESALSTANNRFKVQFVLSFGQVVTYKYNTSDNRWYIISGFFYGVATGPRMNTNVGFGVDPLSNAKLRSRSDTSDGTTSAFYLDNLAGTRLASMSGAGLLDVAGNMVVGGPTSIPITTYSFFVYAKGNTASQGTIYLNNQSGALLTVWDGAGDQRSVGGATFGVQRVPTGRVEIRGKGTSTVATLMLEDSAGNVNFRFRDNGSAQQRLKSTAFDEIIRRDEKYLNTPENVVTAGAINNQAITAGIFNQRFTLATSITGHANGESGRELTINNANTFSCDLVYESAASTAANRYYFATLANLTIPPRGIVTLIYNSTVSRWELKSKNF